MFADAATEDFFRARLDHMIDLRHPLAVLSSRMPWQQIATDSSAAGRCRTSGKRNHGRLIPGPSLFRALPQLGNRLHTKECSQPLRIDDWPVVCAHCIVCLKALELRRFSLWGSFVTKPTPSPCQMHKMVPNATLDSPGPMQLMG